LEVVAVKFRERGKTYIFQSEGADLKVGDLVVVGTERGLGLAWVVVEPWTPAPEKIPSNLKKIMRPANREDLEHAQALRDQETQAFRTCKDLVEKYQLPMKLVEVESLFEGNKLIFYFTAEKRVDFRKLVKELARIYHCKIEMRQIGVRNEAKILGGLGSCGKELCCTTFLNNFDPVSVRMAKDQNLSLNPLKISGLCGRLMCCLNYEHETYVQLQKKFPKCRKWVKTSRCVGRIKRLNVLADKVVLEVADGQEVEIAREEILETLPGKPPDPENNSGRKG
jgi:cell fate regulator YaaT (PSP1 superfamily)